VWERAGAREGKKFTERGRGRICEWMLTREGLERKNG